MGQTFSFEIFSTLMFHFKNCRNIRDGIKGLKLPRCGKLNFTYHGKLQRRSTRDTLLSLVYCGSCTAAKAAIYIVSHVLRQPQQMSRSTRVTPFLLCGASCTAAAALGIDAPQFEPFYMVPKYRNILLFEEKTGKAGLVVCVKMFNCHFIHTKSFEFTY